MTILDDVRTFLKGGPTSKTGPSEEGDGPDGGADLSAPTTGYDGLDARQVMDQLPDRSQAELEATEDYERANKNRIPVLNKLRYMRGDEPLPGYDALTAEEIATALADADIKAIRRVRTYERKFANRPDVLNELERVFRDRQASKKGA